MSRIGKKPVAVPAGVTVSVNNGVVNVKGKLGTLSITHRPEVTVEIDDSSKAVVVSRREETRASRAYHGMTRALVANMILGVTEGYKKELEVVGVGWSAQVQGPKVKLKVGYADDKIVAIPQGVTVVVTGPKITITGIDKQAVGQTAAEIRSKRKPEPYNGKGIKYVDEVIVRKQGKAFGSA